MNQVKCLVWWVSWIGLKEDRYEKKRGLLFLMALILGGFLGMFLGMFKAYTKNYGTHLDVKPWLHGYHLFVYCGISLVCFWLSIS